MTPTLRLHYAPDNASLCVRLALEALDLPYQTVLVDRRNNAQRSVDYLALNPNGLIPVLETPDGVMFETGAILLWLADRHPGQLMPAPDTPARAAAVVWHLWLANTLHPALRMLFYPQHYNPADPAALRTHTRSRIVTLLDVLDTAAPAFLLADAPTIAGCYLAPMLRWAALYGGDTSWFDLRRTPRLASFAVRADNWPCTPRAASAEGLGPTPFSAPSPANPPEGSAL